VDGQSTEQIYWTLTPGTLYTFGLTTLDQWLDHCLDSTQLI